jgi:hypothetical protein
VTFILMGHKFREKYTNGDVRKGESDRGLVDALTRRINTKHPVAASYLIKSDASARVDKRVRGREIGAYRIDRRTINTYADWTKRAVSKGRVDLDDHGTYVEWYLLPDGFNIKGSFDTAAEARDSKPGTFSAVRQRENGKWGVMTAVDYWLPYDGKGFLIAQYEHEMVPLYPGKDRLAAHKQWGINNVSVSDRVGLIIHAPVQTKIDEWGVTQNESRSTLTGPNGSPLPLSEWSDAFEAEFPEEIAEALRKMMPTGKDDITPEDVERLRAIIGERDLDRKNDRKRGRRKDHFDPSDPIEHTDVDAGADPNGDAESTGETVKTRPEHESDIPIDDPTVVNRETVKTGKGRKRKVAPVPPSEDNLPNVLLLTAAEWEAVPYKPEHLCEVERNGAGVTTIFLNEGHSIYANQLAYYGAGGQYFKEHPTLRKKVHLNVAANAVKVAYQIEAVVKVLWIAEDIVPFDKDKFAERTDAQAMTDALSGYQNVDHAIKTRIGGSAR